MHKYSILLLAGLVAVGLASEELEYRPTKLKKELVLECSGDGIVWMKMNGTDYALVEFGENVVQVGSNLKVLRVTEEDLGSYACYQGGNFIQGYDVDISFRLKKMPLSVSVDQGSSTKEDLKCSIVGDTDVIFRWYTRPEDSEVGAPRVPVCGVEGDNCQEDPSTAGLSGGSSTGTGTVAPAEPLSKRAKIITVASSDGVAPASSILVIDNAQLSDRNNYICQAIARESQNITGYQCDKEKFCEEVFTILRVKDPLAALWPFLGIVAEVVCLCLVIFFCERRKAAQEKEEELEDDGYAGNNVSANSSLRQRK